MMSGQCSPSEALFFSSMHRRLHWILSLSIYFEQALAKDYLDKTELWIKTKKKLYDENSKLLDILFSKNYLGFQFSSRINDLLDDTPVDSFLHRIYGEFCNFEAQFFKNLQEQIPQSTSEINWHRFLGDSSTLWGRKIAGEHLVENQEKTPFLNLYPILLGTFAGGSFLWNSFILRRQVENELEYELSHCPHQTCKSGLACQLESRMYEGFAQTLFPGVKYKRETKQNYCFDFFNQ